VDRKQLQFTLSLGLTFVLAGFVPNTAAAQPKSQQGKFFLGVDISALDAPTGSRAGDDVVQLYAKHLGSKVARPIEELKGFQRVTLKPNETKTVDIPLKASALAYWDARLGKFKVEAEPVKLMIGSSSKEIKLTTRVSIQ
jgi:beta-glucosidase